jgi:hypothetical protein
MRIYRVSYQAKGHKSYDFFANGEAARAAVIRAKERREKAEIEGPFEVELTRDGVLSALQRFGSRAED